MIENKSNFKPLQPVYTIKQQNATQTLSAYLMDMTVYPARNMPLPHTKQLPEIFEV